MPIQKSFPSNYAATLASTGLVAVDFGFPAAMVTLTNDGAGPAYVRLSTGPASTSDFQLSSGGSHTWHSLGTGVSGFSFATTSTGNSLRAGAWG